MKLLEELMNVLFQEYGGLLLTVISVVLSIIAAIIFANIISNNITLIRELNSIAKNISGWLND